MTDPAKLRRIAQEYLQTFFTADLSIDRVQFSPFGGIKLTGVTLADPCGGQGDEPLATCRAMTLHHKPLHLLLGRLRFDSVDISGARCRAVFDDSTGHFNVQDLLAQNQFGGMEMVDLPRVSTGDIDVDIVRRGPKSDALVERLTLNILALPNPERDAAYDVVWDATTDRVSSGTLQIDFDKKTIRDIDGGTPWLSVRAAALATEAATPGARYWMDLLGLQGQFHAVDFALPMLPVVDERHHVAIQIEQAAISIPIDAIETKLPPSQRYLTWTDVAGTLQVGNNHAFLDFIGYWNNCLCRAKLQLNGTIDENTRPGDIGFALDLEAKQFTLPRTDPTVAPAESRLIASLPKLAKFYRHYDPHGQIDLSLSISKAVGRNTPIILDRALIEALGPDVSHHKFPYRITNVRGTVEIGPDGLNVIGINGSHGDGWVIANGWTGGPAGPVPADIDIYGYNIALDDDLCAGMGPQHRKMWDSFSPEGVTDLHVSMQRSPPIDGAPSPWSITTTAQVESADAVFAQFPYPINDFDGLITIENNEINILGVQGQGETGEVAVGGIAETNQDGLERLELHIVANDVALDERLFSCFEPKTQAQLQQLHPEGTAEIEVDLSKGGKTDPIDYVVNVDLNQTPIRHSDLLVPIKASTGHLRIDRERIEVDRLTGRLADGHIELDGFINREPVDPCLDIRAKCQNMTLSRDVIDSFPLHLRKPLQDLGVSGTLNADAIWKRSADDPTRTLNSTIHVDLKGVSLRHPRFPIPIEVNSGTAVIDGSQLTLTNVIATGHGVNLNVDGTIRVTNNTSTGKADIASDLRIDIAIKEFNESIRDAAPWRIRKLMGNIQPKGSMRLRNGQLVLDQSSHNSAPNWSLNGTLETDDLSLQTGLSFENLSARLPFTATSKQGVFNFDGQLTAPQVTIAKLGLENVRGSIKYDAQRSQWSIGQLSAVVAGSTIGGELQTWTESGDTHYGGAFTFDHVPLEALTSAFSSGDNSANRKSIAGTVVGQVSIDGVLSDSSRRRAGGSFQVKEAELYKLPALLAILNVINLTLPKESAFQEINTEFYLSDDELQFRNLHLKGNALAMVGEGEMEWSTKSLDLKLTAISPKQGSKIPVVTELLEGASREVIEVRVTGTMNDPVATGRPFRTVSNALETLWQPKEKDRNRKK
ncbi:MAG: hypothetical protein DHS20C16_24750 [Phycisphaerae bacterium]|nr:MAG: hypothetical protein DHS20C16_24750 [Phycisphaerae bacterium]